MSKYIGRDYKNKQSSKYRPSSLIRKIGYFLLTIALLVSAKRYFGSKPTTEIILPPPQFEFYPQLHHSKEIIQTTGLDEETSSQRQQNIAETVDRQLKEELKNYK